MLSKMLDTLTIGLSYPQG